jgi:hypothetical protein
MKKLKPIDPGEILLEESSAISVSGRVMCLQDDRVIRDRKRGLILAALACVMALADSPATAGQAGLRNLPGLAVIIEFYPATPDSLVAPTVTLQPEAERQLRDAGVVVLLKDPRDSHAKMIPYLHIKIWEIAADSKRAYALHAHVVRPVTLPGEGSTVLAATWDRSSMRVGTLDEARRLEILQSQVRATVRDLIGAMHE